MTLNVGVVKVPDERLDRLAEIFKPKKIVQADVTYADLPAPPASSRAASGPRSCRPTTLPGSATRTRCSTSSARSTIRRSRIPRAASIRARDLEQLDLEFMLADLAMAERRLERLKTSGRHGTAGRAGGAEREEVVLRRLHEGLEAGTPIRDLELDADEEKAIRGFRFLTQKPVLVLLNVGEGDLAGRARARGRGSRRATPHRHAHGRRAVGQDRDGARRARARRGGRLHGRARHHGVEPRSRHRAVVPAARAVSFLTAGPDEVRAWPIRDGSTAVDAAGAIHTDLASGFIRAETVAYEDLITLGSMAEARKHGRLRSEGKTYRVRDGDVRRDPLQPLRPRGSVERSGRQLLGPAG